MTTATYSARLAAGLSAFGFMEDRSDRSKADIYDIANKALNEAGGAK